MSLLGAARRVRFASAAEPRNTMSLATSLWSGQPLRWGPRSQRCQQILFGLPAPVGEREAGRDDVDELPRAPPLPIHPPGQHPDWDVYCAAMIEQRCLIKITPTKALSERLRLKIMSTAVEDVWCGVKVARTRGELYYS